MVVAVVVVVLASACIENRVRDTKLAVSVCCAVAKFCLVTDFESISQYTCVGCLLMVVLVIVVVVVVVVVVLA